METINEGLALVTEKIAPVAPPLPGSAITSDSQTVNKSPMREYSCVSTATRDFWDRLFHESYRADVCIETGNGSIIYAHATILGMASPVIKGMLKQSKKFGRRRMISIQGVPHEAVRIFVRFLYSCCYEKIEMEEYVLNLLVLSHVYMVPHLKKECGMHLEKDLLNTENVIDVFQLALLCDAPRLSVICHHMILNNFKAVSSTDGWQAMKESHPMLEKELLESVIDEDDRRKERSRRISDRKMYMQLYEAMEALVHICRDGCRTIGPCDKDFNKNQPPCKYGACKGLELLIRHFARCKLRVPGGCIHCKRMWQLFELHSHLCADSDLCRVPLCRNFKERTMRHSKKEEMKWKMLAKKILSSRGIAKVSFIVKN